MSEVSSTLELCEIVGCRRPATVLRPATRRRERAVYCDYDASRLLGWGDTFRPHPQVSQ